MYFRMFLLTGFFVSYIILCGCRSSGIIPRLYECLDSEVKELESPNRKFIAKSYYRDCGVASSGNSTVIVRRSDQSDELAKTAYSVERKHSLFMIWKSDSVLSVECLDCNLQNPKKVDFQME